MNPTDSSSSPASYILETIPVGMLEANCYLVADQATREALVLDPGAEPERILERIAALDLVVVAIVHTHGHFDHISATEALLDGLGRPVPILAHPADAYLYEPAMRLAGSAYGYTVPERRVEPEWTLRDGAMVRAGAVALRVLQTPGHTPGSVSLVYDEVCVFSGDTLFHRGIGRTDLKGGDEDAIYESITTRLYTLPPHLAVYPGHGPATTIGEERRENPFVRGA